MSTAERCYPELRERAVRMVRGQRSEYSSEWATMRSIAEKPAARPRRCASGYGGRSATRARARAGRATSGSGSRRWNGRIGSSGGRTRSCARPRLFSRRRNSAAARSDAGIHRPASGGLRGRADLREAADRPVDVLCTQGPTGRPGAVPGPSAARRDLHLLLARLKFTARLGGPTDSAPAPAQSLPAARAARAATWRSRRTAGTTTNAPATTGLILWDSSGSAPDFAVVGVRMIGTSGRRIRTGGCGRRSCRGP